MRVRVFMPGMICALVALILCLDTPPGRSQGIGGKKGGKGGGFGNPDPGQIFDFMAKGKDHIVIADQWRGKEVMEYYAKKQGISDGKFTKDQYVKFFEVREQIDKEYRESIGKGDPGAKKAPEPVTKEVTKEGGKGEGKKGKKSFDPEDQFKRYDINADGKLNEDEISKTQMFKFEWKKWDENKDNLIALAEWKAYMDNRFPPKTDDKKGEGKTEKKSDTVTKTETKPEAKPVSGGTSVIDDVDDTLPVIHRAGNLPKELPDWFAKLDTNKDGQVSLMEWMKGSRTPSDFLKYDRNDDGLITPEEVLRANGQPVVAAQAPTKSAPAPAEPEKKKGKKNRP